MVVFVPNCLQNNGNFFPLSFKGHSLTFGKHIIHQLYKISTCGVKGMCLEHEDGVVSLYLLLGAIDINIHLSFLPTGIINSSCLSSSAIKF